MRMIINEFLRVLRDKTVIFLLAVMTGLNVVVLYIQAEKTAAESLCSVSQYNTIYDEIADMSNDEAYEYLQGRYDELTDGYISESITLAMAYRVVIEEVNYCAHYDEYLARIEDDALKHNNIAIFASTDSYGSKNIVKTADVFRKLWGNQLKTGPSRGVNMLTGSISTDIIAVIMLLAVTSVMIIREKESGAVRLVKSCRRGRCTIALARFASMVLMCILIEIILYIPNAVIAGAMYGFGDTDRLIQSVYGFVTTEIPISVSGYIVLFMAAKLAVLIMVSAILMLIMNLIDSSVLIYAAIVALFGIEAVLFYTIGSSSRLMALKNLNIYALIDTNRLFETYRNLRMFGNPVEYKAAAGIMTGIIILIAVITSAVVFSGRKSIAGTGRFRSAVDGFLGKISLWDRFGTAGMVSNELYKIFIKCKVGLIMIIAAIFLWKSYVPITGNCDTVEELYYLMCVNEVAGEYSDEKVTYITERLEAVMDGQADIDDKNKEKWITGYSSVLETAEYIKDIDGGVFMYDRGYAKLTGKDVNNELVLAILSVIILTASVFGIWTVEYTSGMSVVLKSSKYGRRFTGCIKLVISFVIAAVIFVGVHLPWYHNVLASYGSGYLDVPACNMQHLSTLPSWITIREYLIAVSVIKVIIMCGIVMVIKTLAIKTKSHIMTIITTTGIFVLPLVILRVLGELV